MSRFCVYLVSLVLIFQSSLLAYSSNPKDFVKELVVDAISKLSDKNLNEDQKKAFIKKIALENVDIRALGMYTLGETRKKLDSPTLKRYEELFQNYFLKSLTSRLSDYSSNKFEVTSVDQKSSTYTIVKSKVIETLNQPEIKIDWRVYTKDPLKPLIRDLIVEGLSLARTQKEEFTSILNSNNNDINFLFKKLEEFIEN